MLYTGMLPERAFINFVSSHSIHASDTYRKCATLRMKWNGSTVVGDYVHIIYRHILNLGMSYIMNTSSI